jgi:hypothetical protein
MAQPKTFAASKLYIHLGDGGSPEVFGEPCGLTSHGITLTKDTNDVLVPDCADPDAPAWLERAVRSLSGEASGAGILAAEALPDWQDAFDSTTAPNVRVGINAPAADNGGYYGGKMHLTSFAITGELGDKLQVAVTFVSDGVLTWVPVA